MTPAREATGLALAALFEVSKHFEAMDSAVVRKAGLELMLKQTQTALSKATAELKQTQGEFNKIEAELKAKSRVLDDQRTRLTQDLDGKISAAHGELDEVRARIGEARRDIQNVDASRESLIRRLRV
jgi:chromosome segregation ATPase